MIKQHMSARDQYFPRKKRRERKGGVARWEKKQRFLGIGGGAANHDRGKFICTGSMGGGGEGDIWL